MKTKLAALLMLFSASALAHPIEQLYSAAEDLSANYSQIMQCNDAINNQVYIEQDCEYVAKAGAGILEILVESLEHENVPVLRENRKELRGIAWDNLSLWEIGYGWWILDDAKIKNTSKYIGKHKPEMVRKYLSADTYNKLEKGGFLD